MTTRVAGWLLTLLLSIGVVLPSTATADREKLGYGRLMTNDYFGDGEDRWRTGAWTSSRVWGSAWDGAAPATFGDVIELRLSSEIIAPNNLKNPSSSDRPYAGSLSIGAHSHFKWQGFDAAVGGDFVFTGSGTGLGRLQRAVHKALGATVPASETLDAQISGGVHPTLVTEIARDIALSPRLHLRPFLEGRAGAETLVRAGADLTFGNLGLGELLVRENVTGHRYRVVGNDEIGGFSFVVGGDMAHVSDSIYLPEDRGFELTNARDRLRAGVHWQGHSASAFYGVTYLGKEFKAQTDDQIVGSIQINFSF
ncbi:MAG: lipid A-modifier LpxR family protein [Sulfitobacter sp.]